MIERVGTAFTTNSAKEDLLRELPTTSRGKEEILTMIDAADVAFRDTDQRGVEAVMAMARSARTATDAKRLTEAINSNYNSGEKRELGILRSALNSNVSADKLIAVASAGTLIVENEEREFKAALAMATSRRSANDADAISGAIDGAYKNSTKIELAALEVALASALPADQVVRHIDSVNQAFSGDEQRELDQLRSALG